MGAADESLSRPFFLRMRLWTTKTNLFSSQIILLIGTYGE